MSQSTETLTGGIKTWPQAERPRERLEQCGVRSLSDSELLAVLLRSGIYGKDATVLAKELVIRFGGLRGLLSAEWNDLKTIKGLGPAKISALLVVSEITKRQLKEELIGKSFVRDPETVIQYLSATLRDKKKEVFKVIFLNKGNQIIGEDDLFHGTVDEAAIHPREVVKSALDRHATALVLVHNHPSGRVEPSREDIAITKKLRSACDSISVKVLDHIIIGDNRYFSFQEHNLF